MSVKSTPPVIVVVTLALTVLTPATLAARDSNDPNRYLGAVREFADNVLKYGRDTPGAFAGLFRRFAGLGATSVTAPSPARSCGPEEVRCEERRPFLGTEKTPRRGFVAFIARDRHRQRAPAVVDDDDLIAGPWLPLEQPQVLAKVHQGRALVRQLDPYLLDLAFTIPATPAARRPSQWPAEVCGTRVLNAIEQGRPEGYRRTSATGLQGALAEIAKHCNSTPDMT